MTKLYRFSETKKEYWETWEDDPGVHIVHWGELGSLGSSKKVYSTIFRKADRAIQKEMDKRCKQGFRHFPEENSAILMIEYIVDDVRSVSYIDKRHRLEDRMNNILGWTGLGVCDGGSIGSGSMEVCNFVVDFAIAKRVVENDLVDTESSDYTRIYDETSG